MANAPDLSAVQTIVLARAERVNDGVHSSGPIGNPNNDWGYGKLDIASGLATLAAREA